MSDSLPGVFPGMIGQSRKLPLWIVPALIVALVAAGMGLVFLKRGHALTEKDSILITDFVNTTADPIFDGALKKALAVDLEQSPYLNVFPTRRSARRCSSWGAAPAIASRPMSVAKSVSVMASRPC